MLGLGGVKGRVTVYARAAWSITEDLDGIAMVTNVGIYPVVACRNPQEHQQAIQQSTIVTVHSYLVEKFIRAANTVIQAHYIQIQTRLKTSHVYIQYVFKSKKQHHPVHSRMHPRLTIFEGWVAEEEVVAAPGGCLLTAVGLEHGLQLIADEV